MKRSLCVAAAALALLVAQVAGAAPPDEVFLVNGGRLRGVVMEDDPKGVAIQLLDGSTRQVPRSDIMRVAYGSAAAPASAAPVVAAPVVAPQPLPPAPIPGALPALDGPGSQGPRSHHIAALWVTGLSVFAVSYGITVGVTAGISKDSKLTGESTAPLVGPFIVLADAGHGITGGETAGLVLGGVLQNLSMALFLIGASVSVQDGGDRAWTLAPMTVAHGSGAALHAAF